MKGGFISNNEAKNFSAGGVDACRITFIMTGGVISGNKANGAGGGVFAEGKFEMTGGVIYGSNAPSDALKNTATEGMAVYKNAGANSNVDTSDDTIDKR
jgi:hypothetical protein